MTHGWKRGVLSAYDENYKVEQLVLPFLADACPQLAGKPKLFFIHVSSVVLKLIVNGGVLIKNKI